MPNHLHGAKETFLSKEDSELILNNIQKIKEILMPLDIPLNTLMLYLNEIGRKLVK